jgi:hypothetical protein
MSDTNNSYEVSFDRNQIEEDLNIVISDLFWQEITDRFDEALADVMAYLAGYSD